MPENIQEPVEENTPAPVCPFTIYPFVKFFDTSGSTINSLEPGLVAIINIEYWGQTHEVIIEAYANILAYMTENNMQVRQARKDTYIIQGMTTLIPYSLQLAVNGRTGVDPSQSLSQPEECPSCNADISFPTVKCENCDHQFYCVPCRAFRHTAHWNRLTLVGCCNECGVTCDDCGDVRPSNMNYCNGCDPHVYCNGCSSTFPEEEITYVENLDSHYCSNCVDQVCYECANFYDASQIVDDGHVCAACYGKNQNEEFDDESESELGIPSIPGREVIRLCGLEIEGGNGKDNRRTGHFLAEQLYHAGLCAYPEMTGYHSGSGRGHLVHVERDSSVDWEMVVGPINAADPNHMRILDNSVDIVRRLIKDEQARLDMRAGLHIHVEAKNVALHNAYNLHKLYMHNEDFLYRLGAAKWPFHRAIPRDGQGAAMKSPETVGKLNFAKTFAGNRYYGLSFENYFARYFGNCSCGARTYGLFEECTCDLGKCTFEFRLFNTTSNKTKIHAYLAICQALVAKAVELDEITENEYPVQDFIPKKVSDMTNPEKTKLRKGWEKSIRFVNEELPLTVEEKRSLYYCVVNSEMAKIVTNAEILLEREEN